MDLADNENIQDPYQFTSDDFSDHESGEELWKTNENEGDNEGFGNEETVQLLQPLSSTKRKRVYVCLDRKRGFSWWSGNWFLFIESFENPPSTRSQENYPVLGQLWRPEPQYQSCVDAETFSSFKQCRLHRATVFSSRAQLQQL
ncbi:uncharacterized protein LOC117178612 [Belonocnema kinseyi]|uniref:uncharacterized protein LOC117178612 n=1 Tax=Belonocnema kinseyi TaxID=2817044 RepID=UPI00143D8C26|nr:uncharacterized protein LOC117178612 [Belonocnema kinseyi]